MGNLPFIDIFGYWVGIFLTFCVLSFLYKDNPFYKFAEHLFIGISIGLGLVNIYYHTLQPKLVENLQGDRYYYWIALAFSLMLFTKFFSKRWAWLARIPIAFLVAYYAGLQINGVSQGDFGPQLQAGMRSVVVDKIDINRASESDMSLLPGFSPAITKAIIERRATQRFTSLDQLQALATTDSERIDLAEARDSLIGISFTGLEAQASVSSETETNWFGTFSQILMLLGLLASLVYFYFSVEHTGVVGKVSRFGVWILMLGFGAAFGATVQGRLSLAVGRALDVLGRDKHPQVAEQIHGGWVALVSIALIVAGIVAWESKQRRAKSSASE